MESSTDREKKQEKCKSSVVYLPRGHCKQVFINNLECFLELTFLQANNPQAGPTYLVSIKTS